VADVHCIVVIRSLQRIVAACAHGLFWAQIPATSAPRAPYDWKKAKVEGAAVNQGFWDVAVGAKRNDVPRSELQDRNVITIVASGFGQGGLFVGQWNDAGELAMRRGTMHNDDGTDATGLFGIVGTCSVASCEDRPTVLFSGCAWKDGRFFRALHSEDGGSSWGICNWLVTNVDDDLTNLAGDQGGSWNNCIAVSPSYSDLVSLGWVSLFFTLDRGKTWRLVQDPHLHGDVHALCFHSQAAGSVPDFYVGSDGGVAHIDLNTYLTQTGSPFQSNYNRQLPTLQCYATHVIRNFYGTLAVSKTHPGQIAVGLQDNGNVHCMLLPTATPWLPIDGSDGGWNAFLADGALLHNSMGRAVAVTQFNATGDVVYTAVVPITQPVPIPTGLNGPVGEAVVRPSYRNAARQVMHAVAASKNDVFGLYVDDVSSPRYQWQLIGSIPAGEVVAGLASYHGGTIFVGTQGVIGTSLAEIYVLDSKQGTALKLSIDLPKPSPTAKLSGGNIPRIVMFTDRDVFALMNNVVATDSGKVNSTVTSSYVLRLDGLKWVVTPGMGLTNEQMLGLEAVAVPNSHFSRALFVSTDEYVYTTRDDGATWQRCSLGLPRNPHCADLRSAASDSGAYLYLSTYGRSVWVAPLRQ
jgi:hypothetical protein